MMKAGNWKRAFYAASKRKDGIVARAFVPDVFIAAMISSALLFMAGAAEGYLLLIQKRA